MTTTVQDLSTSRIGMPVVQEGEIGSSRRVGTVRADLQDDASTAEQRFALNNLGAAFDVCLVRESGLRACPCLHEDLHALSL